MIAVEKIIAARKKNGFTQMHLAERAGVDVRSIQRLESGKPVSANTMRAVCAALNLDADHVSAAPVPSAPRISASATPLPSPNVAFAAALLMGPAVLFTLLFDRGILVSAGMADLVFPICVVFSVVITFLMVIMTLRTLPDPLWSTPRESRIMKGLWMGSTCIAPMLAGIAHGLPSPLGVGAVMMTPFVPVLGPMVLDSLARQNARRVRHHTLDTTIQGLDGHRLPVADRVVQQRLQQHLTQEDLAERTGISVRSVKRIEAGGQVLPSTLRAVCLGLDLDSAVLLTSRLDPGMIRQILVERHDGIGEDPKTRMTFGWRVCWSAITQVPMPLLVGGALWLTLCHGQGTGWHEHGSTLCNLSLMGLMLGCLANTFSSTELKDLHHPGLPIFQSADRPWWIATLVPPVLIALAVMVPGRGKGIMVGGAFCIMLSGYVQTIRAVASTKRQLVTRVQVQIEKMIAGFVPTQPGIQAQAQTARHEAIKCIRYSYLVSCSFEPFVWLAQDIALGITPPTLEGAKPYLRCAGDWAQNNTQSPQYAQVVDARHTEGSPDISLLNRTFGLRHKAVKYLNTQNSV